MIKQDVPAFAGSIPLQYDSRLGPMFFEPFARDLVARVPTDAQRVLETAAGTGVVSRLLLGHLGAGASLMVTDLQPAMLDVARWKLGQDPRVELRVADAVALPFDDRSFDVVVCQFGAMFFSDLLRGLQEARRVLTPDGRLVLNTWGSLDHNPIARLAHEEVARAFPDAPPPFFRVPFGLHDPDVVTSRLHESGFGYVQAQEVHHVGESPSAHAAAVGLITGSPVFTQLQDRGLGEPRLLIEAVAARLAREGGFAPMRLPMKAFVFVAQ